MLNQPNYNKNQLGQILPYLGGQLLIDMTEGKKEQVPWFEEECLRGATGQHSSPSRQLSSFWGEEHT